MSSTINKLDKNKFNVNRPQSEVAKVVSKSVISPLISLNGDVTNIDFDLDNLVENATNVIEDFGKQLDGAKDAVGNFVGNTVDNIGKNVSEILNFNDEAEENNNVYTNKDGSKAYDVRDEQGNTIKTITTSGDIQTNENGNIIVTEKDKYTDAVSKQIIYNTNGDVLSET